MPTHKISNLDIISEDTVEEAQRYNRKLSPTHISSCICPATVLYKPNSREFAIATAVFQHNNRLIIDGKLGPNSRKVTTPRLGGSLHLSELPRLRSDMDIRKSLCLDHAFINDNKDTLLGRIKLFVCSYDGYTMTKRPGDFFGLDGTTLGWPHFAASTLCRYIGNVYNLPLAENMDASKLLLLDDKEWRDEHITDAIHNGGLFPKSWWRRFGIHIAHNADAMIVANSVWYDRIYKTGYKYWKTIGLKSERGLALCVRFRNSRRMRDYEIAGATKILELDGEAAALNYIERVYTKNGKKRMGRMALLHTSFPDINKEVTDIT